jgi:hypothetical protein
VEKCGRARQATDYNIIQRMRIACRITEISDTHAQNIKYLLFYHDNIGYANARHCYIVRTWPVLPARCNRIT